MRDGFVEMRNRKVLFDMQQKYKTITQSTRPLTVFSISSLAYNKHKEGYDEFDEIPISIDLTGIPYLRFQLSKLPAKRRLDVLRLYCDGTIKDLISSLEIWTKRTAGDRRIELHELVARPRKVMKEPIRPLTNA